MKQQSPSQKCIALACSCAFIFILTSGHADAARRSRVLTLTLFASGISFQFGSSLLKAGAQNRYDEYLNAAIQSDIQVHKNAYLARKNASLIMSRVGIGCVSLAVLFSIYNQLNPADESSASQARLHGGADRYAARLSGNTLRLLPRTSFQLRPHYDFQTRRTSLRFLHHF